MSHSSTQSFQAPPSMKKKIVIALLAVVVGHTGVLWVVSQMKTPELKPIEKKPIKVRMVTIKEDELPPPPPPPAQPVKPKIKPKPVPLPPPVVKPKVIAQKPEKVQPKAIHQDDSLEKKKIEKERLDNQQRLERERQDRERQERERQDRERQERERQDRERQERERQERERQNANTPRVVSEGQVTWSRKPSISEDRLKDLIKPEDGAVSVNLEVTSDGKGNVTNVKLMNSTGNQKLEAYVIKQTYAGKFKPFLENGASVPFVVRQSITTSVVKRRR